MIGDKKVIQLLTKALSLEITAVNQYFLHARMYKNWGLKALGKHEYEESIEEMRHADKLIERILFLEGAPTLQDLGKPSIGKDVPDCIGRDLKLEVTGRAHYQEAIAYCESVMDYVSREILARILEQTEDHIDYLETQTQLIEQLGLPNYLQSAMGEIDS
ncbi:MAG TPA: bacterioferritin [Burkholderiaceae bacterium]|nr:bacterioferritin [Burkholderiaceae bacterium]